MNVEIDEHGWEYGTTFSQFSLGSKRRVSTAMDYCRRRRWTRTRVPITNPSREKYRPLNIFWDVKPLENGAKKVYYFYFYSMYYKQFN